MGKEKTIYTRRQKTTQAGSQNHFQMRKRNDCYCWQEANSHFICVAALSSAGSGFPVRGNRVREQLNPGQEVVGFINLILWIIMPPSFTNEPTRSKWSRFAFFNVLWTNIVTVCSTMPLGDKTFDFQKSHFLECTQNFNSHASGQAKFLISHWNAF